MSQATSIIIFGASGDLTERKLVPALYNAYIKEQLPDVFHIIGTSRSDFSHEEFRTKLQEKVQEFSERTYDASTWRTFAQNIYYRPGNAKDSQDYAQLNQFLEDIEGGTNQTNRLFYLSTAPSLYEPIIKNLGENDMLMEDGHWRHLVIEKPFGTDLPSARALNDLIHKVCEERQVYRIDHYLGKETAQNILYFRFANTIFEPIWNRDHIANVQITVAESVDVGRRAGYYDQSGVLRDMFQNHLLQLLSLVAMEPPVSFEADALRDEKVKVLRAIPPIKMDHTVRAQYLGYQDIDGVTENSQTPTFAALKLNIDNWRWQGVPFYLRSGKALRRKTSQINIVFKCPPHMMFNLPMDRSFDSNMISICIQPDEGINLSLETKVPGTLQETRSVKMGFQYDSYFGEKPLPDAYERLLVDAIKGDASLFTRSDGIEAAWELIDPIIRDWEAKGQPAMTQYEPGTWGPLEADNLLGMDGFVWHEGCS